MATLDKDKLRKMLDYYISWDGLPEDAYLLDCQLSGKGKAHFNGVYKTFHDTTGYRVRLDGEFERVIYALRPRYNRFPYRIQAEDRIALQNAAPEVKMRFGDEGEDTAIVSLIDAAPIILKNA